MTPGLPVPAPHRDAWLEIDLGAMRQNVAIIRERVTPAAVAAVVKADAYGHGIRAAVTALADVVDALCVATLDEAILVRQLTATRVLLLYPVPEPASADGLACGAELTIMSVADLKSLQSAARDGATPVALQLCVETGLGRGGVPLDEVVSVATIVQADQRFRLAGLWSHLASPEDPAAAARQVARFDSARRALQAAGIPLPARHLAASSAIFCGTAPGLQMVRSGLAVYGVLDESLPLAGAAREAAARLRPAMSLKARPVAIIDVPIGEGVGYGSHWRAQRPSRVAILPLGYADGYLRGSQPGARALVRGLPLPLVGVISMDALAVDVTDVRDLDRGEELVLLGEQAGSRISVGELARARNTIAWEVLSGMAARVDRVYHPEAVPEPSGSAIGAVPYKGRPTTQGPGKRVPTAPSDGPA